MPMRENATDLMDIYEQVALASRCELAILRARRLNNVREDDKDSFVMLSHLFDSALAGDATVSSSQLTPVSAESIEVLRKTLRALTDQSPVGDQIKKKFETLRDAAATLADGKVPFDESIDALQSFVHRYRLIQHELIRNPQRSDGTGVSLWNLAMRTNYLQR